MTFTYDQYQLLDFGKGEKLESFGDTIVRRRTPSVPSHTPVNQSQDWSSKLTFVNRNGERRWVGKAPEKWHVHHGNKCFLLRPTPAGQIGLFPEQAANWEWIESLPGSLAGLNALNLFAYTGGTTLSLALRGVNVVHVDSARNVVKWAKQNAAASQSSPLPIRWIVEDSMRFLERELKRGSKYEILIADPPSYGKGPRKETWKFSRDIGRLTSGFAKLASSDLRMTILSGHTPGYGPTEMERLVGDCLTEPSGEITSLSLRLKSRTGRSLASGSCARYFAESVVS